jgi:hypothetical protein
VSDLNNIEKLFHEKLENFEMPVRAELWDKVAAGAGIGKTIFWTGTKISAAVVAGLVAIASLSWLVLDLNTDSEKTSVAKITQHQPEDLNPGSAIEEDNVSTGPNETVLNSAIQKPRLSIDKQNDNTPAGQTFLPNLPVPSSASGYIVPDNQIEDVLDNQIEIAENVIQTTTEPAVFTPAPTEILNLDILYAPEKTTEKSLEQIHFPHQFVQVFSPSLAGEAGQFSVYSENLGSFKIEIKTRAGKLVFTSTDPNFVWRGEQMDGSEAPEGTYMYTIFSTTSSGESIKPQAGSVFLMRK